MPHEFIEMRESRRVADQDEQKQKNAARFNVI